jgi:hypothetical protein
MSFEIGKKLEGKGPDTMGERKGLHAFVPLKDLKQWDHHHEE